ncbi:hypothetical protein KIW84_032128 [Lathyrus oleraceus]|uniref:TNase-like domain-containing protein n=1 Tax=Pisum sativum TaxID=3888 RepID=A0A9D4XX60_PEA|nr:hypothetical protein KIW84_032128 [Pisum sativum]
MEGIVEQVHDGSTILVYLLSEFQFVQVFVAEILSPQMGKRVSPGSIVEPEVKVVVDPSALEVKFFTEMKVLNRYGRIILEGVDKSSNLIGSVYYPGGESAKDLALELVENGYAKYDWSANMLEEQKNKVKS